jgi:hypothetical protein
MPSQCSYQEFLNSTVYFKHCSGDQICNYVAPTTTQVFNSTCAVSSSVTVSVVGEYCGTMNNVAYTCGTGLVCTGGKCVLDSKYTATSTLHCTPGTYYSNSTGTPGCVTNLASGAVCTADDQCVGN